MQETQSKMPRKRQAEDDYSKLTVAKLKELCNKRGLSAVGKKQELVDILKKADSNVGGKKVGLCDELLIVLIC